MRARSNAHTHTAFSDGRDTPRQQVERALALGFRSLGFSDHAVQEVDAFTGMPKEREADYFLHLGARALEERPAILGHFDIVKYFNGDGSLYDADSPVVRRAWREALAMARESGALLEVNTGGMARGYVNEPYPSWDILRAWRDLGGGVILGSDCHDARLLDFAFDDVLARLRAEGFGGVWELGGAGEPMFVERRFSDEKN